MLVLYVCGAVVTFLIGWTLVWIKWKSYKPGQPVLASVSEAWVTLLLAVFCLAFSYFVLVVKIVDPATAGNGPQSYWLMAGFSAATALLGCYSLLYTLVKRCVILPDRLVDVDVFGNVRSFRWQDIQSVRIPAMSKNLNIRTTNGSCSVHSGNAKEYKTFVGLLRNYVPRENGGKVIAELYNRL